MAKSIKDKVAELESQNLLLANNLVDAVWVINAGNLKYEYITPSIYRISGYTAEELIGKPITHRFVEKSKAKALVTVETFLDQYEGGDRNGSRTIEVEMIHKNGGTYWAELWAKLMEEPGRPIQIVGITRDITPRKTAELKMEAQNRELAAALAEKARLLKEIKVLQSILPICSGCRRIRDDSGKWWPLDAYVNAHTDSDFTHTICPDCKDVYYPYLAKKNSQ
jgi:PAS domain S-box-containing protein